MKTICNAIIAGLVISGTLVFSLCAMEKHHSEKVSEQEQTAVIDIMMNYMASLSSADTRNYYELKRDHVRRICLALDAEYAIGSLYAQDKTKALIMFADIYLWMRGNAETINTYREAQDKDLQEYRNACYNTIYGDDQAIIKNFQEYRSTHYSYGTQGGLIAKKVVQFVPAWQHTDLFGEKQKLVIAQENTDEHTIDYFVLLLYRVYIEVTPSYLPLWQRDSLKLFEDANSFSVISDCLTSLIKDSYFDEIDLAEVMLLAHRWNLRVLMYAILQAIDDEGLEVLADHLPLDYFPGIIDQLMSHERRMIQFLAAKVEARKKKNPGMSYEELFTESERADIDLCVDRLMSALLSALTAKSSSEKKYAREFVGFVRECALSDIVSVKLENMFSKHRLIRHPVNNFRIHSHGFHDRITSDRVCYVAPTVLCILHNKRLKLVAIEHDPSDRGPVRAKEIYQYDLNVLGVESRVLALREGEFLFSRWPGVILKVSIGQTEMGLPLVEARECVRASEPFDIFTTYERRDLVSNTNAQLLVAGLRSGSIELFDVQSGLRVHELQGRQEGFCDLEATADYIMAVYRVNVDAQDKNYVIKLWNSSTFELIREIPFSDCEISKVKQIYGNRIAVACYRNRTWSVCIHDVMTGRREMELSNQAFPVTVLTELDGRYLLVGKGMYLAGQVYGCVQVYDLETQKLLKTVERLSAAAVISISVVTRQNESGTSHDTIEIVYSDGHIERIPKEELLRDEPHDNYLALIEELLFPEKDISEKKG